MIVDSSPDEEPDYAVSWSEMAAAMMAHLAAYGSRAVIDVDALMVTYTRTLAEVIKENCCPDDDTRQHVDPVPGLSPHMHAALALLADGRPRTAAQVRPDDPQAAGRTLRALSKRGLVDHANGLWWRR